VGAKAITSSHTPWPRDLITAKGGDWFGKVREQERDAVTNYELLVALLRMPAQGRVSWPSSRVSWPSKSVPGSV
jgi:hypothetical protein